MSAGMLAVAEDTEAALLLSHKVDPSNQAAVRRRSLLAAALGSAGLLAAGIACLAPGRAHVSPALSNSRAATGLQEQVVCAAAGGACHDSQCCVDGGQKGLQCYAKNDFWAECADSCTTGVHEGEKDGAYQADGQFHLAEWSCKELGNRSQPGCETHAKKGECPSGKCSWKDGACMIACNTLGSAEACASNEKCMWKGACLEACGTFTTQDTCQPTDKCVWDGEAKTCQEGCWTFGSIDTCPGSQRCMWNGTCVHDPCSAPGEDCASTKCCSKARGGSGMTCFKKDATWSSCTEVCGEGDTKDWACKALGPRTNYSAGCAWSGESCAVEKLCCNVGHACAVKDEFFTGCVLVKSHSTWIDMAVPMPAGWAGTVVGGSRNEYQVPAAAAGEPTWGNSMYCFIAFLPGSYEVQLVDIARNNNASVFGCDAFDLFHSWQSGSAGWDTGTSTLVNTDVFVNVWSQVQNKGTYKNFDWTVKVDADAVMVPQRLRDHLGRLNAPRNRAIYIKNNGMDPGLGNNGFLGAVEVFSRTACDVYFDNAAGCHKALGDNAGEDGYFKGCLDGIGVGFMWDKDLFFPDHGAGACMQAQRAAFHPLKNPDDWQHCWDIVLGKVPW